jgi:hypothetical protein
MLATKSEIKIQVEGRGWLTGIPGLMIVWPMCPANCAGAMVLPDVNRHCEPHAIRAPPTIVKAADARHARRPLCLLSFI